MSKWIFTQTISLQIDQQHQRHQKSTLPFAKTAQNRSRFPGVAIMRGASPATDRRDSKGTGLRWTPKTGPGNKAVFPGFHFEGKACQGSESLTV